MPDAMMSYWWYQHLGSSKQTKPNPDEDSMVSFPFAVMSQQISVQIPPKLAGLSIGSSFRPPPFDIPQSLFASPISLPWMQFAFCILMMSCGMPKQLPVLPF